MKKNYITLVFAILLSGITFAQEPQKNFINYQGVARNGANQLMANENMTIGIALKVGSATGAATYAENHSVATDANGVFSLKIGNGDAVSGDYNTIPWGSGATFVTVLVNGSEIGTTEMMAVPYALSSGDASQSAIQVPYDNALSGLAATNTQEAIDELVGSGAVDADADPANELQILAFDPGTNELSLSDGNTVTIPSGGTDADADPTNELQTISFDAASNEISLTDGGTITIPSGGTDADADPTNELQTLTFDAVTNELSLTDGGTVTLPSGGADADADPTNEIDVTAQTGLLLGDGAVVTALEGTADGQVAKWDAGTSTWVAGTDLTGGGGGSLWSASGTDINYTAGNVGVGTTAPSGNLEVSGNSNVNIPHLVLREEEDEYARLAFGNTAHAEAQWHIAGTARSGAAGTSDSRLNFWFRNDQGAADRMTILGNGNVGIGTITPATKLSVNVDGSRWDLGATEGDFRLGDTDHRLKIGVATGGASAGDVRMRAQGGTNRMMLGGGTNDVLTINDQDVGIGTITPSAKLDVAGSIRSSDLVGSGQRNVVADANGNLVVDGSSGSSGPIVFKVVGEGFAIKNLNGGAVIEADIWENEWYDTANAFNETTKRFVAPEAGYYYLHSVVDQANAVSNAFFAIKFNIMGSWLDGTHVDGDTVETEISGIFRLAAGQEVFVQLRNYSAGEDSRLDGFGSWFEGYKIN